MLGYIVPDKPELKVKEFELYFGYYCGICKSIENRYGQIQRMTLNYDAVFLALIIGNFNSEEIYYTMERCPIHPLKKRLIVCKNDAIDYAADIMLMLAYYKFLDDVQDEGKAKAKAGAFFLRRSYKRLMKYYKEKCNIVESRLKELYRLEKEKCSSLDRVAEPFARLMEEIFVPKGIGSNEEEALLRIIGYYTGKWIFLIDAFDDLEDNLKRGTYNPLVYQFAYDAAKDSFCDFKNRIKKTVEYNLMFYLAELAKAWECLGKEKNRGIIDNIIYFGLLRKTEEILSKGNTDNAKSL